MDAPRDEGDARTLLWTPIDARHRPTGRAVHRAPGGVLGPARGLRIVRQHRERSVHLFHCDETWGGFANSFFATVADALRQAASEFEGVDRTWMPRPARETAPLDRSRISQDSARFAEALFRAVPEAERFATQEGEDGRDLHVTIPSPTQDPDLDVEIWMEGGDEPSIGFGPHWHTHAGVEGSDDAIVGIARAILDDRLVQADDAAGPYFGHTDVLDLGRAGALEEALTDPNGCPRLDLRTWSGEGDRVVGVEDL
ncbi:MAG: hypothetical protein AAFU73_17060 [Planctomycetota bacterium]